MVHIQDQFRKLFYTRSLGREGETEREWDRQGTRWE